jgi:hypothetical protein
MFAQFDFTEDGRAVLSFAAGSDRFREILERDGVVPAPYRARIYWIALEHWRYSVGQSWKSCSDALMR